MNDDSLARPEFSEIASRQEISRVLITGASGYIGTRLLAAYAETDVEVMVLVRSKARLNQQIRRRMGERLHVLECDFSKTISSELVSQITHQGDFDAAYYLLHSMSVTSAYAELEKSCAVHFTELLDQLNCLQIVYLGALKPNIEKGKLSKHLGSREEVYETLMRSKIPVTVLRASIIVGSGSSSFEIVRDLAEKLPVMITPKWVRVECQPIAVRNVIQYLVSVVGHKDCIGKDFDIGGPEILTYKDLLLQYAKVRGLKRWTIPVPWFSPKLSSYWLYFITATNMTLAKSLVGSLSMRTVCQNHDIGEILPQSLLSYEEAIERALSRIAQNRVPSTWYDSLVSGKLSHSQLWNIKVPEHGVYVDEQTASVKNEEASKEKVWSLGGDYGWPSMNWAWRLRGELDKLFGGIGLRRGRRHPTELRNGDALDFWRVLLADKEEGRLILYAEMKLPGEAWLEFSVERGRLTQRAVFRPCGLLGRMYWWFTMPVHLWLFPQMAKHLASDL